MNEKQLREQAKKSFSEHTVKILENTRNVQMFICGKPGTSTYRFQVVCADNMICLTGDIYSMLVEPGYGRSGLAWMRGSINSEGYFLSKIREHKSHYEFDPIKAKSIVLDCAEQYKDDEEYYKNMLAVADSISEDDKGDYGEYKFYESWNSHGLEEPPNVLEVSSQTIYQLEGLKKLCELLDEMNFRIGETTEKGCFWNHCQKDLCGTWINSKNENLPVCKTHLDQILMVHNGKEIKPGVWQVVGELNGSI